MELEGVQQGMERKFLDDKLILEEMIRCFVSLVFYFFCHRIFRSGDCLEVSGQQLTRIDVSNVLMVAEE